MPEATLRKSLDYSVRVSDKSYHISPTRGQLGNALKCVWAAPFVVDGSKGRVDVSAHGQTHLVEVTLDQIARKPILQLASQPSDIKTGTSIRVYWPTLSSYRRSFRGADFYADAYELVADYVLLNPHASFTVRNPMIESEEDDVQQFPRLRAKWTKWNPSEPTSAWWYDRDQMADLIRAEVSEGRNGGRKKTVRQFIAGFAGLSGVLKQKQIFRHAMLPGQTLEDLVHGSDVGLAAVGRLLKAMQEESRLLQAKKLGALDLPAIAAASSGMGIARDPTARDRIPTAWHGLVCSCGCSTCGDLPQACPPDKQDPGSLLLPLCCWLASGNPNAGLRAS